MTGCSRFLTGLVGAAALMVFAAHPAFATSSVCPVMTGGNAGGAGGVSGAYTAGSGVTDGGCNVLITFNADGSITTTHPNAAPSYDNGDDDNLVGIVNLTGSAIPNVTLFSTFTPFGFDGDGACDPTFTFAGGDPCGGTSGYGHAGVTFSGVSSDFNTGTVNFAGGIAASGGSNWFSLEGPVDKNLQVNPTPEPSSLMLLGTGLLGLVGTIKRKIAS